MEEEYRGQERREERGTAKRKKKEGRGWQRKKNYSTPRGRESGQQGNFEKKKRIRRSYQRKIAEIEKVKDLPREGESII